MSGKNLVVKKEDEVVSEAELITLDLYLRSTEVGKGMVASFKAEDKNDTETPRTAEQWDKDFKTQASRKY
jgi:hypothetical protein